MTRVSNKDWGDVEVEGKVNVALVTGAFTATYILFIIAGWLFVMGAGHPDVGYSTTTFLIGVVSTLAGHKVLNKVVGPRVAERYRSEQ